MTIQWSRKSAVALLLIWVVCAALISPLTHPARAYAADASNTASKAEAAIAQVSAYVLKQNQISDWQAIGLSRAGKPLPAAYTSGFAAAVANVYNSTPALTDYARLTLAAGAIGLDATNIEGHNLIQSLYTGQKPGVVNGAIYALLAYDSLDYKVADDANLSRAKLLEQIMASQDSDGSFGSIDMSAMALTALSCYKDQPDAATAAERTVAWLKKASRTSSESVSQLIIGLTAYGIDPTDESFVQNGANLIEQLLSYQQQDGSFAHLSGGSSNALATEQALQALVAYQLFTKDESALYRYTATEAPTKQSVSLFVEGPQALLASGEVSATTAQQALETLLQQRSIAYTLSSDNTFFVSINSIANGSYTKEGYQGFNGWMFVVERSGQLILPMEGMSTFKLEQGDKVTVYYADMTAPVVSSFTTDPVLPQDGEPFTVKVLGKVLEFGTDSIGAEAEKPVAGAKVEIGSVAVTTDAQGVAQVKGLPAGDYPVVISGYVADWMPTVVRSTATLKVDGQVAVTSQYRIEGLDGEIASGAATGKNALEAVKQLLESKDIPYLVTSYPFGSIITSINGLANGQVIHEWEGWNFAVKRSGSWIMPDVGMGDFQPQENDQFLLYYGDYGTPFVQSATVIPAQPKAGQPFKVLVSKWASSWNNETNQSESVISPAAGVQVKAGTLTAVTDDSGIAQFAGLPSGDSYALVVSSYAENKLPNIVRHESSFKVSTLTKTTNAYRIEGPQGKLASGEATAFSPLEGLLAVLEQKGLSSVVKDSQYGSYIQAIDGLSGGTYGGYDGWSFAVKRGGQWDWPSVGIGEYDLLNSDEVVVFYGGDQTELPVIEVSPSQPVAGSSFTVTVSKQHWDWNAWKFVTSKAEGATVTVGGKQAVTNANGVASFSGLAKGSYVLEVKHNVEQAPPALVRAEQTLVIQESGSGGVQPTEDKVTVAVQGHSKKGTIVSSTSVKLEANDTAYSVLARLLGDKGIAHVASGTGDSLYVRSIDGLSESFSDRYPSSGWKYAVNGSYPNQSAGSYKVKANDTISWCYTLNGTTCDQTTSIDGSYPSTGSTTGTTGGTDNSSKPTTVAEGFKRISLPASNQQPLDKTSGTTAVLHASQPMSAVEAEQLAKKLQSNEVSISKSFSPNVEAVLSDSQGEVKLAVPAGGLSKSVTISVTEQPSTRPELVSGLYRFTPAGTVFQTPVTITIQVPVQTKQPEQLVMVWLNEQTGQWIPVPTVVDVKTGQVTGKTDHFTWYAVVDRSKVSSKPAHAVDVSTQIAAAARYILSGEQLTDWEAFALARSGQAVPAAYLTDTAQLVAEQQGKFSKVTELERLALSIRAAGGRPESFGGYNLIEAIYNHERMMNQGPNGPAFALLTLDSGSYETNSSAKWSRDKLIGVLISQQQDDGGYTLSEGNDSDVDVTAMVLTALAPYQSRAEVKAAIDKALQWLAKQQLASGGFQSLKDENSESAAQVIIALTALGLNPKDGTFVKSGKDALDALLSYRNSDGGFAHKQGEPSNEIATEQALQALAAYQRYVSGQPGLYVMTDQDGVAQPAARYVDDASISAWASAAVYEALEQGVMSGVSAKELRFAPQQAMTRAEFAALLIKLGGHNTAASADMQPIFADVQPGSWYYGAVMKAKELGYLQGVTSTRFMPEQTISRQEMAIMIARAFKLQPSQAAAAFADSAQFYQDAEAAIQAVYEQGIMTGYNGRFAPREQVTREMAAVVAVKLAKLAS